MTHEEARGQIEDFALRGRALPPELEAHLASCPACREHARAVRLTAAALLHAAPEIRPPEVLKSELLQRTRTPRRPRRRRAPLWAGFGLAAALALAVWWPLRSASALAAALPDPAVVVAYGPDLVVANNVKGAAPVSVVEGSGRVRPVRLSTPRPAWFTEGVRLGRRVYLADAGNDRVVVIDVPTGRVVGERHVSGGVAGLCPMGEGVVVKTAGGGLTQVHAAAPNEVTRQLAPQAHMPLPDVMDAVAASGSKLFVTHHARGEVYVLDAATLRVLRHAEVGGAPVALATLRDGVLVLDHAGALLWLDREGRSLRREAVPGHPDKLALSDHFAYASDRAGRVTRIDLNTGKQLSKHFTQPMDLAPMQGGHVALADGSGGLKILDAQLDLVRSLPER